MKKIIVNASIFVLSAFALIGVVQPAQATDKSPKTELSQRDSLDTYLNADVIEGNWKQLKGKIQQKWAKLTNDDILKLKGTYIELEGILQEKYGYKKEEAEKEIHDFLEANKLPLKENTKK